MKRIVLTTGGTGGHIFPALAVAEEIRLRHPGARVLFIGGKFGPERKLAEEAGLEFVGLPARGILGRGLRSLGAAWWLTRSMAGALATLVRFRPEAVAGFGGYAGFCPVLAARLLGVPTVIHEQNSVPGMTNRFLGRRANLVLTSFPDMEDWFDADRTVRTGNPVRSSIRALARRGAREGRDPGRRTGRNVLVMGGSQGSRTINKAVVDALGRLRDNNVNLWHQTGTRDLDWVAGAYEEAGMQEHRVEGFIADMEAAYTWADLTVCRAGATTIAELAAVGLPSILVPFPHATHDHQTTNAAYLERADAARVIPDASLDADELAELVLGLLDDRETLETMARSASAQGLPDAAGSVVDAIERLLLKRG